MPPTQVLLNTDGHAGLSSAVDSPPPLDGDGKTTSLIAYDRLGRVVKAIDDNGHFAETRYDGLGRRLTVLSNPIDIGGTQVQNSVSFTYDGNGNVLQADRVEWGNDRSGGGNRAIGPLSYRTLLGYDAVNRLNQATYVGRLGATPLNFVASAVYDSRGNKIQVTDPQGGRTLAFYDGLDRLQRTERGYFYDGTPLDDTANPDRIITTRYTYDVNSRLTSIVDDNLRTTSLAYDNLNRPTRLTYPDGVYKELTYNLDSQATRGEEARPGGSTLILDTQYDVLHRAARKDIDRSAAPEFLGTQQQSFEYDGLGRMTLAVDDGDPGDSVLDSQVEMTYDSLGDVLTQTQAADLSLAGYSNHRYVVSSVYDGVGFRTQVTYPGGRTVGFVPDELNRLDTLQDSYTGNTRYDYLGPARVLNRAYPNNTKLTLLTSPTDEVAGGYDARGADGGSHPRDLGETPVGAGRVHLRPRQGGEPALRAAGARALRGSQLERGGVRLRRRLPAPELAGGGPERRGRAPGDGHRDPGLHAGRAGELGLPLQRRDLL